MAKTTEQIEQTDRQDSHPGTGFYAVITGDVAGSSGFGGDRRAELVDALQAAFASVATAVGGALHGHFGIYRGDGFQGVLSEPAAALRAAVVMRASLRGHSEEGKRKAMLDARVAVAIGRVDYLPAPSQAPLSGDGEAFRRSGRALDNMAAADDRLVVETPLASLNEGLRVQCALLDVIVGGWSARQSESVLLMLSHAECLWAAPGDVDVHSKLTQEQAATTLGITQPVLNQHLKSAGYRAIEMLLDWFEREIALAFPGSQRPS